MNRTFDTRGATATIGVLVLGSVLLGIWNGYVAAQKTAERYAFDTRDEIINGLAGDALAAAVLIGAIGVVFLGLSYYSYKTTVETDTRNRRCKLHPGQCQHFKFKRRMASIGLYLCGFIATQCIGSAIGNLLFVLV